MSVKLGRWLKLVVVGSVHSRVVVRVSARDEVIMDGKLIG